MAEQSKAPDSRRLFDRDFCDPKVRVGSNPTPGRCFQALWSISWSKNNAKSKAVLLLKAKWSKEPDLKALDQNFCYTKMCVGSKHARVRTEKSKWCIWWNAFFRNDKVSCQWSINNFKTEIPFKIAKTTANNPNGNVQCKLPGRMA